MLKIRLRRVGARKQPSYRIVVAESTAPRDGKFVESIGTYNPRTEPETVRIQEERALHWLSVGAQPTESVARIFRTHGTMARFERLQSGEPLSALVSEVKTPVSAKPVAVPVQAAEEPEAEQAETVVSEELEDEQMEAAASDETEESQAA
jgi:small subunit ribosomal protein S16